MSDFNKEDVVKVLSDMTVVELIALTKDLEQKWGVKAEPQVTSIKIPGTVPQPEVQQTEFTVVLASYPADKKMCIVKLVRELTGLGLLESKQLVEAAPKNVKEGVSKEDADNLKAKLTDAGAVVEIK